MLTFRQIADEYGISRSTARRRVMECFPDMALSAGRVTTLTDEQSSVFADWMDKHGAVHVSAKPVREPVRERVERDEQASGAASVDVQELIDAAVREAVQEERVKRLEQERDALQARAASLECEVTRLHEELERVHAALEREQDKAPAPRMGFWARVERLLGDGSRG